MKNYFDTAVSVDGSSVTVHDASALTSAAMDGLVRDAVFGSDSVRDDARWLIWELGQAVGVRAASIQGLYMARGRGECSGHTVPAINVRGATYDTARAIFRTAIAKDAGAFILEIARSEIAYTAQRPNEYVSVLLAAALREGFRGPVFVQGDHFQINAKKYAQDPDTEVAAVRALIHEAVDAGFYNIDVDTSTLVDIDLPTLDEQQRLNYELCVQLTQAVRELEPEGVTVSVGGEIGEVGTQNSTVGELEAFMDGYNRRLEEVMPRAVGLSKISVQSGTTHGGVVLADGSIADVSIDLNTLEELSRVAREKYGLSGAVQHGASTLPDDAFHNFPRTETAEIHLATNFQNMLYDHMPAELRSEIYAWLDEHMTGERKDTDSDEQFYYKTRKKALGPFKEAVWGLPDDVKEKLARAYEEKFGFLFDQLAVGNTRDLVRRTVEPLQINRPRPGTPGHVTVKPAPDDASLSD